jgi:nitrate reductase NapE component
MAKIKTKTKAKTSSKLLYGLWLLYAIAMTGLFLYGFISIIYALIFDQAHLFKAF